MLLAQFPDFELHQLRGYIQDIYLAVYPNKVLLLDGTCRPDVPLVARYLQHNLGRPPEQLRLVVLSHMHPDHAGGASHYRRLFGSQLLASPWAEHWYRGLRGQVQHALDTLMGQFVAHQTASMNRRLWYPARIPPDYVAQHNTPLPGFDQWLVLCTPGHTDHDLSVYHPAEQILYVGDLVLRLRQKFLLPFPIALPELMQRSLTQLAQLPVRHLLMAHGAACQPTHFADTLHQLSQRVWDKPHPQFRLLQPFVGITGAIQRARQRTGSLHERPMGEE